MAKIIRDKKRFHLITKQSEYFVKERGYAALQKVDEFAGGGKVMRCDVFMAAVNYLNIPEFLEHFKSIEWEEPDSVQILLKDEHDLKFKIYEPDT